MIKIKSIRSRTLIYTLPATIIVLCVLSLSSYFVGKNIISNEIHSEIINKMNGLEASLNSRVVSHKRIAETLARTIEASGTTISTDEYKNLVKKYAQINQDTMGTGVWFEPYKYKNDIKYFGPYAYKDNGKIVYTEEYMKADYNYPSQDWYNIGKNSKSAVAWTTPYYDQATKVTMATAAAPFFDTNGNLLGVATADINLTNLQSIVNNLKFGQTGKAFVVSSDGYYIAGVDNKKVMKAKINDDKQLSLISKAILSGKSGSGYYTDENGKRDIYYTPIEGTSWILAISTSESEIYKPLNTLGYILILLSLMLVLIIIGIMIIFSNYITKSITNVTKLTKTISSGDLTHVLDVNSEDELGAMTGNLNKMAANLRDVFKSIINNLDNIAGTSEELTSSADQTQNAAEQVAISMQDMAEKSESQAKGTEEISSSIFKMYDGIKGIKGNVDFANKLSYDATELAENGKCVIDKAIVQMGNISDNVAHSTNTVNLLGDKSTEINNIVAVINDISSQTNLLALNASIEAARAGEHGKGFAVVAEEVRMLAEQSNDATSNISKLIEEIQNDIKNAIESMNKGTVAVADGKNMISDAATSFNTILNSIKKVSNEMNAVTKVIQKLYNYSDDVIGNAKNITDISGKTSNQIQNVAAASEEQAALMKQVTEAAESLTQIVIDLQGRISKFKM